MKPLEDSKDKPNSHDFELLKCVGEGGYGKVYQARKSTGHDKGEIYAMKIIKKCFNNPRSYTKIMTERNILVKLSHQFVCGLSYAFQTKSEVCFVLEYLPGGNLYNRLEQEKCFTQSTAKFYLAEILLALEYLHANNVIYRDLKPENVVLDDCGHVKLVDFGLSKEITADSSTKTIVGTPEYLAPEVIKGHLYQKDVDWWSFGVLTFELLLGKSPFGGKTMIDTCRNVINRIIPKYTGLSAEADDIIQNLLQSNPKDRLGYGIADANAVKSHPFFKSCDWDLFNSKRVTPPFIPRNEDDPQSTTSLFISAESSTSSHFEGFCFQDE